MAYIGNKVDGGLADGNAVVSGTLNVSNAVTANGGIGVDNITIDGTEIDLSSGDLTIDVAGDLVVNADGGNLVFQDDTDNIGELANHSGDFGVNALGQDKHLLFKGNDGGSTITALDLDMENAGAATFNSTVTASTMTLSRSSSNSPNVEPVLLFDNIDSVIGANENIGSIRFTTSGESSGSDANLESGRIACFSESGHGSTTNASALAFYTASSEAASSNERMRIKSDGEVQVASANSGGGRIFRVQNTSNTANSTARLIIQTGGSSGGDAFITFDTHNSLETYMLGVDKTDQRFCLERQDAGLFDGTNRALDIDANGKFRIFNTAADYSLNVQNSQANANNVYGQFIQFTGVSADNRDSEYLIGADTSTTRFKIYGDGDIENHDNSYGSLSDERIKQDIVDANSQWDDIKAIKIRNYKKKDDINEYGDKATSQIGVIAQELETVSPNLIKENLPTATDIKHSAEFGTLYTKDDAETQDAVLYTSDDEEVKSGDKEVGDVKTSSTKQIGDVKEVKQKVKGVKYSVLYMKAVKALQEAMTRIETLEAKVAKLEGE